MTADEDRDYVKRADGRPGALEPRPLSNGRQFSPSVGRNREVVADAYGQLMPTAGAVLEVGSGSGEHGIFLTERFADLRWYFSDYEAAARDSVSAWIDHTGRAGLMGPFLVDATEDHWGADLEGVRFDGVFTSNVIHIAPFAVAEGLFAGAGRLLKPGGKLFLYGPFGRDGDMAVGNLRFDADLKRRDESWGVRDLELELVPVAAAAGLRLGAVIPMPKNNYSVVFERR